MKNRIAATAALTLSLLAVSPALAGMPADTAKGKQVRFSVRNDSSEPMTLQAGDQQVTLAPGKKETIKVAEGTRLLTVNATATHAAGDQISIVSGALSGNTVVVR